MQNQIGDETGKRIGNNKVERKMKRQERNSSKGEEGEKSQELSFRAGAPLSPGKRGRLV